jgi:spore coat protein U-like protein
MRLFYRCLAILAMVACLWGGASLFSKARAATCSFTVTNLAFGSVDVTANAAVDTTATVSITCSGLALLTVQVCVNL